MKILLLGEFSGYFTNLKKGLVLLGHDVTLASTEDAWKKIKGTDYLLYETGIKNKWKALYNVLVKPILKRRDLYGFDVVQIVHPIIYPLSIDKFMLSEIIDHSQKSFMSVAGNCYSLYKSWADGKLGYYTYDDNLESYERYLDETPKSKKRIDTENYLYSKVDGLISIQYEYAVGVRERPNFKGSVILPMDTSNIEYTPNKIVDGKIRIAHGIIKEKFKGTSYILEAMNIIKEKYPNDVELMVDGKMPLDKYLNWLKSCNILIDQCKEHAYGLNAMYAMAMGKIVLGGATKKSLEEHHIEHCPVVHIEPNVQQIVEQLESIIKRKDEFEKIGLECRNYVEKYHDCVKVAEQYIKIWTTE